MRDYGRVHTRFWNNPEIRGLSDDGRLLALYLLTCPHSNIIGAFLCPDLHIEDALKWPSKRVAEALAELLLTGFAKRFRDGRHIVILNYLKWNPVDSPNVAVAALKQVEQLPLDDPATSFVVRGLERYGERFGSKLEAIRERFRKPLPTPEQEQEQESEPKPEKEQDNIPAQRSLLVTNSPSPIPEHVNLRFEEWWALYPRKVEKAHAKKAFEKIVREQTSTIDELIAGAAEYAQECETKEYRFIKHPTTWLNRGCWTDEPTLGPTINNRPRSGAASAALGITVGLGGFDE